MLEDHAFFQELDSKQQQAVMFPIDRALQLVAGPGSGKTKVLTGRVAKAVSADKLDPSRIVVLTFSKKAAHEMHERLTSMLGPEAANQIVLGTFQSVCAHLLLECGAIPKEYSIMDDEHSLRTIAALLKFEGISTLDPKQVQSLIRRAKGAGIDDHQEFDAWLDSQEVIDPNIRQNMPILFKAYSEEMDRSRVLDFDDLVLEGLKLVQANPKISEHFSSILVDEFQDTSPLQYELTKAIAAPSGSLSVVGDANQSISGWRQASNANFMAMQRDFPNCQVLKLDLSYRSSPEIVRFGHVLSQQDSGFPAEELASVHEELHQIIHLDYDTEDDELKGLARNVLHFNELLGVPFDEMAVLVRGHSQYPGIEASLRTNDIPLFVADGPDFKNRPEIEDVLDMLQALNNPHLSSCLETVLTKTNRAISVAVLLKVRQVARLQDCSLWEVLRGLAYSNSLSLNGSLNVHEIASFVHAFEGLHMRASQPNCSVDELVADLLHDWGYLHYLQKHHRDWQERLASVLQLTTYLSKLNKLDVGLGSGLGRTLGIKNETLESEMTPLSRFLVTLARGFDDRASEDEKVTLSTIQGAKGKEFGVVFVPQVEQKAVNGNGNGDKERRLLFVAVTRAKAFCVLSDVKKRQSSTCFLDDDSDPSTLRPTEMAPFLALAKKASAELFTDQLPENTPDLRRKLVEQLNGGSMQLIDKQSDLFQQTKLSRAHETSRSPTTRRTLWHQLRAHSHVAASKTRAHNLSNQHVKLGPWQRAFGLLRNKI